MMKRNKRIIRNFTISLVLITIISEGIYSQDLSLKQEKLGNYRTHFSKFGYRSHDLNEYKGTRADAINALQKNGLFSDQTIIIEKIISENWGLNPSGKVQEKISDEVSLAYRGYWTIAEKYRGLSYEQYIHDETFKSLLNGIVKIGKIELGRLNVSTGRFHASCFAIPTAAINMYFCFFDLMEKVEAGILNDSSLIEANQILKKVGMQSWTQPFRHDETDNNVVQVERFRNHVWWVGGNGIAYRSVLPCAVMMKSTKMLDVLAEVANGAISSVSQNTYNEAFWTEGFTADGAGWGHGKQCLIWGYPIHGTNSALSLLGFFKNSPWEAKLTSDNVKALMNFFRGSSWYYHNGYIPPNLGRQSMLYFDDEKVDIPSKELLDKVLSDWTDFFSENEKKELKMLAQSFDQKKIIMPEAQEGLYSGTRWFYNNDDLIKKTKDYYIFVNMASVRCDGIESFYEKADGFNFYTCDGMTFFQKIGNEYLKALGAWNLTAIPGVTSRQGEDQLSPTTNWRGFCSKHNFAGAATSGSDNAVAGFVFEKLNASSKEDVNDKTGFDDKNSIVYGVKANKFYFMFGDVMLALGAGINNLNPEMEGEIFTTIDQTIWQGSVKYCKGDKKSIKTEEESTMTLLKKKGEKCKNPVWISNENGFSYAVLADQTPGSISFSTEKRQTKWKTINAGNKKKKNLPDHENIFQLWINHGQKVNNDTYGYLVYGGKENPAEVFAKNPVKVLSNNTDLQAASNIKGNIVGASFYNVKSVLKTKEFELSVSAPCAILFEFTEDSCKISLSDARMDKNLKKIIIKTTLPITREKVRSEGKWNIIEVEMPQGQDCGKPVTTNFGIKE